MCSVRINYQTISIRFVPIDTIDTILPIFIALAVIDFETNTGRGNTKHFSLLNLTFQLKLK